MQPRYERMLGFWTRTLSRPQSAVVTPSGSSTSYRTTGSWRFSFAVRLVWVTGYL